MYKIIFILLFILYPIITIAEDKFTLNADQVTRIDEDTFSASGDVELKNSKITFYADYLEYNIKTEEIYAKGNAKVISSQQELEADELTYNMKTETGSGVNIKGFIPPLNYVCAKSFERTSETTFIIHEARISTCSGNIPDWSIFMHSGEMDLEGYIEANHSTADILNTPLIYSPKLMYSVNNERQTGLLFPLVGSDDIKGAFFGLQFFWAPTIDFDMTFGLTWFSNSGLQQLIEARYAYDSQSNFYAAFSRIEDNASQSNEFVRWRVVLDNVFYPIDDLEISLNANHVSDYKYMRDYEDFDISDIDRKNKSNMFFEDFSIKYFNRFANISASYKNNYQYRDNANIGYKKSRIELPYSFDIGQIITDIPFVFLDYNLSYDRVTQTEYDFDNKDEIVTDQLQYNRFDAGATLYVPIDLRAVVFTPYASISYTRWDNVSVPFDTNNYYSSDFGQVRYLGTSAERYWGSAGASLAFKEIYRDFGSFRHGIQNLLTLDYSPKLLQDGLPNFIENDRLDYYGKISYEFINFLKGKDWDTKLTLNQGYDVLYEDQALPLKAELYFRYSSYISNTFTTEYKHTGELKENEKRFQYFTNNLRISPIKYFSIYGEYTYDTRIGDTGFNTSAAVGVTINVWRFVLTASSKWQGYNSDISFSNLLPYEHSASLLYNADCWHIGVQVDAENYDTIYRDGKYRQQDITFYITFGLKGIGDTETQFSKIEERRKISQ